jgi:hypothetical protein
VGTQDKVLRIGNRGGVFTFVVPKSKRVGGTFFSDEGLMRALGSEFISRGSTDMVATIYNEGKALAGIDYVINQRQNPIIAISGFKEAREMFQPKVALENIENFVGNVTPKRIEGRRDEVRQENIQLGDRIVITKENAKIQLAYVNAGNFTDRLVAKFKLPIEGWRGESS